jgi:hypothetical protein
MTRISLIHMIHEAKFVSCASFAGEFERIAYPKSPISNLFLNSVVIHD